MEASGCCFELMRHFHTVDERPDAELSAQIKEASEVVTSLVKRKLQTYQFDALVCLTADVIAGLADSPTEKLSKSFLLEAVNKGMFQVAAAEFHTFCYINGSLSMWMWRKRRAEHYLFSRGQLVLD